MSYQIRKKESIQVYFIDNQDVTIFHRVLWKYLDDGRVEYLTHIVTGGGGGGAGGGLGMSVSYDLADSWPNTAIQEKALQTFKSYQNSNGSHYVK